jgi:hypothetical protein
MTDLLIQGSLAASFVIDGPEEEERTWINQVHWAQPIDPNLPDFSEDRDPEAGKVTASPFVQQGA